MRGESEDRRGGWESRHGWKQTGGHGVKWCWPGPSSLRPCCQRGRLDNELWRPSQEPQGKIGICRQRLPQNLGCLESRCVESGVDKDVNFCRETRRWDSSDTGGGEPGKRKTGEGARGGRRGH